MEKNFKAEVFFPFMSNKLSFERRDSTNAEKDVIELVSSCPPNLEVQVLRIFYLIKMDIDFWSNTFFPFFPNLHSLE
eukprot:snap_masked-scaffold_48-processed-gene-1.66-mRNA-1 protein AED:1.00 eAED:1.00 QI:0/0/0/0/1/1/2/0/76